MKIIKSILISAFTCVTIQATAQAQSQPDFCQIHAGNLSQYVSEYNMFDQSARTIYRPFIHNYQPYKVTKELIAQPLYYTGLQNGSVVAAFELKGKLGNTVIKNSDIVVQHIQYNSVSSSFKILGYCVNGRFFIDKTKEFYSIARLPKNTFYTLHEAYLGVNKEQFSRVFR